MLYCENLLISKIHLFFWIKNIYFIKQMKVPQLYFWIKGIIFHQTNEKDYKVVS
jgi:hypothetical protein